MPVSPPIPLTPVQARVLAVLVEKEKTVPDTYPLSLNALQAGCNQKTSRDPVMNLGEPELIDTLDELKRRSLVIESSGGRVMRYAHNAKRVLGISTESLALLTTLMLRGAQTAAELRINGERLFRFADTSSVEGYLGELAQRDEGGALVFELPRLPGTRENRWMHLLSGQPDPALLASASASASASGPTMNPATTSPVRLAELVELADSTVLSERVRILEKEVRELRETLKSLCEQLGVAAPTGPGTD